MMAKRNCNPRQSAADDAWDDLERLQPRLTDGLALVSALVEGMVADPAAYVPLVGGLEFIGSFRKGLGVFAELDGLFCQLR